MDFRKPTINDKDVITFYLKKVNFYGCEFSFSNFLFWSCYFDTYFCVFENALIFRSTIGDRKSYLYPCCDKENIKPTLEKLIYYSKKDGEKFFMHGVTAHMTDSLNEMFPKKFKFTLDESVGDYIYNSSDLIELKGKKYSAKRNHINKIINSNWIYEDIKEDNVEECITMNNQWYELNADENDEIKKAEYLVVEKFLKNFFVLDLKGGLIRLDGKVVAFTIGEELNEDVFVIHVEKAFSDIQGAYPLINREFAKRNLFNYLYINREEDLGIEGLRKAKRSYYPAFILDKYIGEYCE